MHSMTVFAMAQSAGQAESIATTFGVDWPHLLAQIVSFSVVCAVLYALARRSAQREGGSPVEEVPPCIR